MRCAVPNYFVLRSKVFYKPFDQAPDQIEHGARPAGHGIADARKKSSEPRCGGIVVFGLFFPRQAPGVFVALQRLFDSSFDLRRRN